MPPPTPLPSTKRVTKAPKKNPRACTKMIKNMRNSGAPQLILPRALTSLGMWSFLVAKAATVVHGSTMQET